VNVTVLKESKSLHYY